MSPLFSLTPGEWYLVITCERCQASQPLFADLSRGKSVFTCTYVWRCIECSHEGRYESEMVERYHHPEVALELFSLGKRDTLARSTKFALVI